jgi:hypothetical protein
MTWPRETATELRDFYGRFEFRADGLPTKRWEDQHLTSIVLPYPMIASWDATVTLTRLRCHRRVAESLKRILAGILAHYGSVRSVQSARLHITGGMYSFRRISGSPNLSLHSYGAAIDLDPKNNPLGKPWRTGTDMIPLAVVAIFEQEGWKWGGRFTQRKDCMHFQATA